MPSRNRTTSRVALACASLLVVVIVEGGCVPALNGNEPREPNKQVPASFGLANSRLTSVAQKTWRVFFPSPELWSLIGTVVRNNQELSIQLQELVIAQNEISARQGAYLPKVNASVGAGVEKVGKETSQGVSDE